MLHINIKISKCKHIYHKKECEDEVIERMCCQISILRHTILWSLLRFVVKISIQIAGGKNFLQGMQGWNKSERISCQTSMLKRAIIWSLSFVFGKCKGWFWLQYYILKNIIPARNVRIKWIWKAILPNTQAWKS